MATQGYIALALIVIIAITGIYKVIMDEKARKEWLIGSATDVEGVERLVNEFYYSTSYKVDPQTLKVTNSKTETEAPIKVKLHKGRYKIYSI